MSYNSKFSWKKIKCYIFIGFVILLVVIIGIPGLTYYLGKFNLFGFTKEEFLGYAGVLIGGAITFIILKMTNKNNNENLNKQIETQNNIMKKQFEFELRQKQVKELEIELRNILNKCRISDEAIYSFKMIPRYLSKDTFQSMRGDFSQLINLKYSIEKLNIMTNFEIDNFQLVMDSFIVEDVMLNRNYIQYKNIIIQYLKEYINSLRNLSDTINEMIYLINKIDSRENDSNMVDPKLGQIVKYNPILEKEMDRFSILKSNLDYYICSHNSFKIMGWTNISSEIGKFIKFLNEYILNSYDKIEEK